MAEQIMWAVKNPHGELMLGTVAQSEYWAKRYLIGNEERRWIDAEAKGYRCVRVRITEVPNA